MEEWVSYTFTELVGITTKQDIEALTNGPLSIKSLLATLKFVLPLYPRVYRVNFVHNTFSCSQQAWPYGGRGRLDRRSPFPRSNCFQPGVIRRVMRKELDEKLTNGFLSIFKLVYLLSKEGTSQSL